jgi:pimeloyl-ACP methyl ester carboxylesterase
MKGKLLIAVVLTSLLVSGCGGSTSSPTPSQTALDTKTPSVPAPTDTAVPEPTQEPTAEPTPTTGPTPAPVETAATFQKASCPFTLPAGQVEDETVECGYLVVPEERADPDGPTIRLAVAIFHPPDGAIEPDPIIYLSGGPGSSALEYIGLTFGIQFEPVLTAGRDIIILDQRGVGYSQPALDCQEMSELGLELLDGELDGKELSDQEIHDLTFEALLACEEGLSTFADLSAYNTVANAADVNDLRIALGYDQVNLWGTSYGTRLALGVMRDFPAGVRGVVLDSAYPPDADLYLEAIPNFDRALNVLFDGCETDAACNAAYPDLRAVLFSTVDRLNETPVSFQSTDAFTREKHDVLLDGDAWIGFLFQMLYETDVLPSLPQLIYAANEGDFDLTALILGALIAQREAVSRGMQFSVQCHEELVFSSLEQFEAVVADYPEYAGLFENTVIGRMSYQVCENWRSGRAEARENEPVTSSIPTLVMAGEYDPITPPAWSQHVAETLENSYLFEYPGVGHGASIVAGCPRDMMIAFLNDPTTSPDSACIGGMDLPQFVVPTEVVEPVEFEPFTNEQMGISGIAPVGWTEAVLGVFARGSSALDVTSLIQQAAPASGETLLDLLTRQLGLDEAPESVGERVAESLTWTLYAAEVQGVLVDFALAESNELALIVLLQSAADEHDTLYETVFLPVVDALVPAE